MGISIGAPGAGQYVNPIERAGEKAAAGAAISGRVADKLKRTAERQARANQLAQQLMTELLGIKSEVDEVVREESRLIETTGNAPKGMQAQVRSGHNSEIQEAAGRFAAEREKMTADMKVLRRVAEIVVRSYDLSRELGESMVEGQHLMTNSADRGAEQSGALNAVATGVEKYAPRV